jgi:hypothetical protein
MALNALILGCLFQHIGITTAGEIHLGYGPEKLKMIDKLSILFVMLRHHGVLNLLMWFSVINS